LDRILDFFFRRFRKREKINFAKKYWGQATETETKAGCHPLCPEKTVFFVRFVLLLLLLLLLLRS
jgi:hypothetical protein